MRRGMETRQVFRETLQEGERVEEECEEEGKVRKGRMRERRESRCVYEEDLGKKGRDKRGRCIKDE